MTHTEVFERHRPLLFTIAYEVLGTAADAEDAVQEAYLSWSAADLEQVRDQRAYLVRITTRRALDLLRKQARRREEYVGPWLPEPVATPAGVDDELAGPVSMAMLIVLETLNPVERAVFVLREVFGFPHEEIARVVEKSPANVRQIARRARSHVEARRPRFDADPQRATAVAFDFLAAVQTGDIAAAVDLLAPEVVSISDGGGLVSAARRPVHGADRVARFLVGLFAKGSARSEIGLEVVNCNGLPGVLVTEDGERALLVLTEVVDNAVAAVYLVRNPEKLARVGATPTLSGSYRSE